MNWLTVDDVAKALDLTRSSVYVLISKGKIRHCKLGPGRGKTRFTEAHVQEYIESCTVGGPALKPIVLDPEDPPLRRVNNIRIARGNHGI